MLTISSNLAGLLSAMAIGLGASSVNDWLLIFAVVSKFCNSDGEFLEDLLKSASEQP